MGGSGFVTDPGVIREHVKDVSAARGEADLSADAAQQVTPGGWDIAFGVPLQTFAGFLAIVSRTITGAVAKISPALEATEKSLTAAADEYEAADTEGKNKMGNAGRELTKDKAGGRPHGEPVANKRGSGQ